MYMYMILHKVTGHCAFIPATISVFHEVIGDNLLTITVKVPHLHVHVVVRSLTTTELAIVHECLATCTLYMKISPYRLPKLIKL